MSGKPRILFPLAIDPEALLKFKDPDHKQTHVAAEKLVRAHGILSYGPGDEQALLAAIAILTGRPNRLWSAVVEYLAKSRRTNRGRPASLAEFLTGAASADDSAELVRLALVATGAGGQSRKAAQRNLTERVTMPNIDESKAMEQASSIGTFPKGASRQEVREQLIEPLASRSRLVRIMDPYVFRSFLKDPKRPPTHVEWLLHALQESLPESATISLVGELENSWHVRDREKDEARVGAFLEKKLAARAQPLEVKVRLVQSASPRLQNRFLWFDCTDPFDVLHEFAPLGGDPLKDEFRVTRQEQINFTETARLANAYESATQQGMVSVTKQFPLQ
ncbi:MAG: hypothetical protein ABGX78_15110 [Microbacterium sp.]|uniref:hypothetical protein n=1 Tax=Microbacterium sp. TaxID=51671 RepID=UPI0032426B60